MGAKKTINVATTLESDALGTGADVTVSQFRIYSAATAGTQKTNNCNLTNARTLSAGGKLSIADAAIYVTLGTAASNPTGAPTDTQLIAMLEGVFADGDYIEWIDNSGNLLSAAGSNRLARTAVVDWDTAVAWTS